MPRSRAASSIGRQIARPSPPSFLARPFVPINAGIFWNEVNLAPPPNDAPFLRYVEGADEFFWRSIAAHPVLVRQSLHRLQQGHGIPSVAFCGRSNAGKSSLVNGLLFGRQVARASKTPGRTRQLFTFEVGRDEHLKEGKGKPLRIVDLPGLGFAKGIDSEQKAEWRALVGEYMERADNLRLVVSLVDVIEGVKSTDEYLWKLIVRSMENRNILDEGPPPPRLMVVLTKVDRVKPTALHEEVASILSRIEYWQKEFNKAGQLKETISRFLVEQEHVYQQCFRRILARTKEHRAMLSFWPYVHCVSAQDGHGLPELRAALIDAMDRRYWKKSA
ncbi:GTP-binding protein [Perkinsus chesapeaki]|uniref:GTP-binding protein n=1 Tax=Perkinsus chesapeaki TaxID=330153 RepID=A0A7J6MQ00_PERCH|nr:GTP-binding protein [Perkinsus chesapeaki]